MEDPISALALVGGGGGGGGVLVADPITVRRPRPADRDGLEAMLERCSLTSRYGRFLGPLRRWPAGHLDAVTLPNESVEARVAVLGGTGTVVALASLHRQGGAGAELAVLVEDAWQRRGLGAGLLVLLAEAARARGITTLYATVLSEHTHMLRLLKTVFGPIAMQQETGTTAVTIRLAERSAPHGAAVANTTMLDR
jgi:GNAT superfamily N-acetyltransferase